MHACAQDIAFILEDDIEIMQWPSNRLLYSAPLDWQILQLYSIEWLPAHSAYEFPTKLWVHWGSGYGSTGAYIITRRGMRMVCPETLELQTGAHVLGEQLATDGI